MYKFKNSTDEERKNCCMNGGEWIYGISPEEQYALFFGKVRTLFGINDSISDDWENMYYYHITAEDENGNKLYFVIYHGCGGPSIEMPFPEDLSSEYEQAKTELIELIENAEPSDYVWEGCYDFIANIKYTIKDGKAYVEYEYPEDMEDFM